MQQLVRLLHNDSEAELPLKSVVLQALAHLSHSCVYGAHRRVDHAHFQHILNALDSNLNHGIFMTMLRENIAFLQSTDPSLDDLQYTDSLLRLVKQFLDSPQGASNLGFAGVVPLLLEVFTLERPTVWKVATMGAEILSGLLSHNRYHQLLPLLIEAGGLATTIRVIKVMPLSPLGLYLTLNLKGHVDGIISMEPKKDELTWPQHHYVHTSLILLLRILKAGHGERVRNVVDSQVIGCLREIFNNLPLFGGQIGQVTTKLLATIIHNEPTSYAALHESGLPQAFLNMIRGNTMPVSGDLLNAIPSVFDAICINTQGKELFSKEDFEGFFRVFRSLDHCKVLSRGHYASDTGAAMDELLRHHPDLKEWFMQCFIDTTREVCREILPAQEPVGPKMPKLLPGDSPTGPATSLFSSGGSVAENKNTPTIMFTRALVSV